MERIKGRNKTISLNIGLDIKNNSKPLKEEKDSVWLKFLIPPNSKSFYENI